MPVRRTRSGDSLTPASVVSATDSQAGEDDMTGIFDVSLFASHLGRNVDSTVMVDAVSHGRIGGGKKE